MQQSGASRARPKPLYWATILSYMHDGRSDTEKRISERRIQIMTNIFTLCRDVLGPYGVVTPTWGRRPIFEFREASWRYKGG